MEVVKGEVCISHSELTDGIIPVNCIQQLVLRGKIKRVRRACYGTPALYSIDSLPRKTQIEVYRRWPDLKAQATAKPLVDLVEIDGAAVDFFTKYQLPNGNHLPYAKQTEYANNAAVLNAIRVRLEQCISRRAKSGRGTRTIMATFWDEAAQALPRVADKFPNNLPQNPRRLAERYRIYVKGGYETLISQKFMNTNAAKVTSVENDALLKALLSDPRNFNYVQVANMYNQVQKMVEGQPITTSTVSNYAEKYDLITAARRTGLVEFENNKTMQFRRRRPQFALSMWTLDGWDCELLFQERNDKNVVTYHNRLTLVVVLDPVCDYPIGYAIGRQENIALITAALRNAANHTAELFGRRFRCNQIQSDHYAIKAMTPFYEVVGKLYIPAKVKNAKSKPIERYFRHLNDEYCHYMPNWSGYGITSNKDKQPNAQFLNDFKRNFPDEAGCRKQVETIMQLERERKHDQYMKSWESCPDKQRLPLEDAQYLLAFGDSTGYRNVLEGRGLCPTLLGQKRAYDSFDPQFRYCANEQWAVLYDPADLSHVLAVNPDGTKQFLLEEKYVQSMAIVERGEKDVEEMQRVHGYNELLKGGVAKSLCEAQATSQEYLESIPESNNLLARLVLCDSLGQHKDERNQVAGRGKRELLPGEQPRKAPVRRSAKQALPASVPVETSSLLDYDDYDAPVAMNNSYTPDAQNEDDIFNDF